MMHGSRVRQASLLIVILLAACDNIEWGGIDVAVVAPPPKASGSGEPERPGEIRLPSGPVLYYVQPAAGRATIIPVAEIAGDTLRPLETADWERYGQRFIAEQLRNGSEFALFRHGRRVGTFVVQSAGVPDITVCPRVPRASGLLELAPGAEDAPEFLAMAKPHAPEPRRAAARALEPDRRMQILAPMLAERLLRARDAPLPSNWTTALRQLAPFPLASSADAAFTATLLVGDTLGLGLDDDGYSLFFLALPAEQAGYAPAHVAFVDYARAGKAAPRLVDYLDWNRDGEADLLLEVYGTHDTWFETVGRVGDVWRSTFRGRCETARAAPAVANGAERAAADAAPAEPTTPAPRRRRTTAPAPQPRIELAVPPELRPTERRDTARDTTTVS